MPLLLTDFFKTHDLHKFPSSSHTCMHTMDLIPHPSHSLSLPGIVDVED